MQVLPNPSRSRHRSSVLHPAVEDARQGSWPPDELPLLLARDACPVSPSAGHLLRAQAAKVIGVAHDADVVEGGERGGAVVSTGVPVVWRKEGHWEVYAVDWFERFYLWGC